ncbi:MAG: cob(I)yrinic acid a,c-diamide adenosyltransferase [Desulfovibrio sp.]|nr:cob(I)yrinic acid a,c-diamide adenosyltransferase [Desulfovibrio sp.]
MIVVYTGDGKGKTCACVGQSLRALGQGMAVAFGQFMKRDGQAGEQRLLKRLLGRHFFAGGLGFLRHDEDRKAHREAALSVLDWARDRLIEVDMLVLDETLYALKAGIVLRKEVEELIADARQKGCHLVLSGRNAPDWLVEEADLVTSMTEIKHPWRHGVRAAQGMEF